MIPAIVLAAGTSSRYGADNKLLASIRGQPLVTRVVTSVRPVARPIIVVTGHQADRVRSAIEDAIGEDRNLRFVHNRRYREGMASSLKLGVARLPTGTRAAFVCLGDMPCIDAQLLRRLRARWHSGLDVVRPMYQDRPGHPVLVSAHLFDLFEALTGDRGAQKVLASIPDGRKEYVAWHAGCVADADTPVALRRLALRSRRVRPGNSFHQTMTRSTPWT